MDQFISIILGKLMDEMNDMRIEVCRLIQALATKSNFNKLKNQKYILIRILQIRTY